MSQILHILKKDVRRHWPEILVAWVLLGLYLKVTLQAPNPRLIGPSFPWLLLLAEWIPPLMMGFWIFLAIRLVQGESLVGDRQWWVTKPYEWWKLLAAKELFLLAFIAVPLFFVQLYLLHHAGFPVVSNLSGVLNIQYGLGLILFLLSVAIGCLTRNLWQAVLTVILGFVGVAAVSSLLETIPNSSMSGGPGAVTGPLVMAAVIGALAWQYARRRTWASRGLFLGGLLLNYLVAAMTPYALLIEREYPFVEGAVAPAHFTLGKLIAPAKKHKGALNLPTDVYLNIPLSVSGIAPGQMVRLDGVRASVETPASPKWGPGWRAQYTDLWPEYQQTGVTFPVKRKDFESIKTRPVQLQLELALTEFQEADARDLILEEGEFPDALLGICHLDGRNPSWIDCVRPFEAPGLMATFDPSSATCDVPDNEKQRVENRISHAWFAPHNDSRPTLNPVVDYQIFLETGWEWVTNVSIARTARSIYLCPGAKVRLAKPQEKNHVRVKLQLDSVRLQDLVTSESDLD